MTENKIIQIFKNDLKIKFKLCLMLGIAFILLGQFFFLQNQDKKHAKLVREKAQKLAELESLANKTPKKSKVMPVASNPSTILELEGMSLQKGIYHAVINGQVYMQGDKIEHYVVDEITMNSTTLKDYSTQEIRTLYFSNPELVSQN